MKKTLIIISTLLLLSGCQVTTSTETETETQQSKSQNIVTSFYPLQFIAESIVGDLMEVSNVTQGKDPHSYSLTPQDIQSLQDADLFVFQGAGLESWAENIAENRTKPSFEVAEKIELLATEDSHDSHSDHEQDHHSDEEDDGHEDDHHDEDHHSDEDSHTEEHDEHEDEHGHNHGEFDPHTWLDPILLLESAEELTQEIIAIDPANQEIYEANLTNLSENLSQLDNSYSVGLSACSNKVAISSHDAFSYAEVRYGFKLFPISGLSPQDEPSSQDLEKLITEASEQNITHILEEEYNNASFAETIQRETGLQVLQINPLGSTPQAGKNYIEVMQENLSSFQEAFQCQ